MSYTHTNHSDEDLFYRVQARGAEGDRQVFDDESALHHKAVNQELRAITDSIRNELKYSEKVRGEMREALNSCHCDVSNLKQEIPAERDETINQLRRENKMKDEVIAALRAQLAEAPPPVDVESDDVPEAVPVEVPREDYRRQMNRWLPACDYPGFY